MACHSGQKVVEKEYTIWELEKSAWAWILLKKQAKNWKKTCRELDETHWKVEKHMPRFGKNQVEDWKIHAENWKKHIENLKKSVQEFEKRPRNLEMSEK